MSSERKPESSSSDGALLALRDVSREVCFELLRELLREVSREAALRETVLPLSKIWRRRSGMVERRVKEFQGVNETKRIEKSLAERDPASREREMAGLGR